MKPQHLHVRHHQPRAFAALDHFRQSGNIAAGKNIFLSEGIGDARPVDPADRVDQHHAIGRQQVAALVVEGAVMGGADMFEHADRDDAVEGPLHVAIVDQFEPDMVGDAGVLRPLPRHLELFLREGDAGHVDSAVAMQVERHAAPAAADVQHFHAGFQVQLGGDMRLLVLLRLFQADARLIVHIGEIGAAILAVAIEEERVERARQIIMMRDIGFRARLVIGAPQLLPHGLETAAKAAPGVDRAARFPGIVRADHGDELHYAAALYAHPAIDPGFGHAKARVPDDVEGDAAVMKAQGQSGEGGVGPPDGEAFAIGIVDRQLTACDQPFENTFEKFHAATVSPRYAGVKCPHTNHSPQHPPKSRPCRGRSRRGCPPPLSASHISPVCSPAAARPAAAAARHWRPTGGGR